MWCPVPWVCFLALCGRPHTEQVHSTLRGHWPPTAKRAPPSRCRRTALREQRPASPAAPSLTAMCAHRRRASAKQRVAHWGTRWTREACASCVQRASGRRQLVGCAPHASLASTGPPQVPPCPASPVRPAPTQTPPSRHHAKTATCWRVVFVSGWTRRVQAPTAPLVPTADPQVGHVPFHLRGIHIGSWLCPCCHSFPHGRLLLRGRGGGLSWGGCVCGRDRCTELLHRLWVLTLEPVHAG